MSNVDYFRVSSIVRALGLVPACYDRISKLVIKKFVGLSCILSITICNIEFLKGDFFGWRCYV